MKMFHTLILLLTLEAGFCVGAFGFGSSSGKDKVLLQDVNVLTLHHGKMTTGRRSSPVPQLKCVGGSAAGRFTPQVVQCYNRGWDGQDVQWECKSDMDGDFRFGAVEVVCEGYDYPDDPYILKGSCGLEYTLDYTKDGQARSQHHDYYGGGSSYGSDSYSSHKTRSSRSSDWSGLQDLILLGVAGLVIYALYKTCLSSNDIGDREYSSTDEDYPRGNPGGGGWFRGGGGGGGPHGGGYGSGGYGGGGYYDDASCNRRGTRGYGGGGGGGGGGFWTGMATGGLMGYMFGNRGNNYGWGGYNRGGYYRPRNYGSTWGGGGWGGGGGFGGGGGATASAGSSSSGTRTASGFGGTRRR